MVVAVLERATAGGAAGSPPTISGVEEEDPEHDQRGGELAPRHAPTGSTASAPTARVKPMPRRPPRPTNSEAGRTLKARKREARRDEAGAARWRAPSWCANAAMPKSEAPAASADRRREAVGVAEAVDRLHDDEDEDERAEHVEDTRRRWVRAVRRATTAATAASAAATKVAWSASRRSARSRRRRAARTIAPTRDRRPREVAELGGEERGRQRTERDQRAGPAPGPTRGRVGALGPAERCCAARARACRAQHGDGGDAGEQPAVAAETATTDGLSASGHRTRGASGGARGRTGAAARPARPAWRPRGLSVPVVAGCFGVAGEGSRGTPVADTARPSRAARRGRRCIGELARAAQSRLRARRGPRRTGSMLCSRSPYGGALVSAGPTSASASFSPGRRPVTMISMSSWGRSRRAGSCARRARRC